MLRLLSGPGGHRRPSRAPDLKGVSLSPLDTRCAGRNTEALSHVCVGTGWTRGVRGATPRLCLTSV